ncbi:MAG: GlsB/YeaQ/YmgE family stress response membrane protein [Micropruina sp.]|nr:GlsB/YeaQ/YmgE family stress response membrane protein [Micropruina sp.]
MFLGWGFLGWIILGGIAGWIASKIMKTDPQMGIIANIVVGVVGALLGGFLLSLLNVDVAGGGLIFSMLTAIGGAVLLLWLVGFFNSRRSR